MIIMLIIIENNNDDNRLPYSNYPIGIGGCRATCIIYYILISIYIYVYINVFIVFIRFWLIFSYFLVKFQPCQNLLNWGRYDPTRGAFRSRRPPLSESGIKKNCQKSEKSGTQKNNWNRQPKLDQTHLLETPIGPRNY